jgi:class 3 adenylate cyclase
MRRIRTPAKPAGTIRFDTKVARTYDAIALIYDLEGFSQFVNQPDAQNYVSKFFNHVSRAVETVIYGGHAYWLDETYPELDEPIHQKFLGDGALYIWEAPYNSTMLSEFSLELLNRLRFLSLGFATVERNSLERVPIALRPQRIRFGLSVGRVHRLKRTDLPGAEDEFVGICINLASRLQAYCPGASLVASARLGITKSQRDQHHYERVLATKIKGFPPEPVILDTAEYQQVKPAVRAKLFSAE